MQREMEEIKAMLPKGLHRSNSTSSLRSVASFAPSVNSKEAWKQLCRDPHRVGVTADMIRERKDQIVNLFQGSKPPVVVEETLQIQSTESSTRLEDSGGLQVQSTESSTGLGGSDDPPKDAKPGKKKATSFQNQLGTTQRPHWTPVDCGGQIRGYQCGKASVRCCWGHRVCR